MLVVVGVKAAVAAPNGDALANGDATTALGRATGLYTAIAAFVLLVATAAANVRGISGGVDAGCATIEEVTELPRAACCSNS